ncbi:GGDEF domain-containing protein [Pseudanabaena mucicola]|uniref:GGDEF domain-containing protein n=1 Tax=Pseudanabaena mucicola FACHB-723 TaxID=2692860 RepID=A0ABR7ZZT4_9CYAN|nr:GGDEF domain-containing protein [Pseudanabaena mucicola]MBD2189473.1 GGDEF domain-containing protein [Pseudanabaena mucicola FACHB-723]
MTNFNKILYEALLVAFGKVLAKYNVFAQGYILKDVGEEIINYLNSHGFAFEEKGNIDDLAVLTELFVKNGFADCLEIEDADIGKNYIWKNLYGIAAYKELFDIADNPFLSCPLNLCLYYIADKHHKTMRLYSKSFDMEHGIAQSQYDVVEKEDHQEDAFGALILENVKLYELARIREEQYHHQSITDALTGISNRRHIIEEGTKAFSRAQRYNLPLSILMIDIDRFKRINDIYGHSTGDRAICVLASICRQLVREMDLTGRLGGEEFVIILPDTSIEGAYNLAERIRKTVEQEKIQADDNSCFSMSISIGVTDYHDNISNFENMLSIADNALYKAKNMGRNRVVIADAEESNESNCGL